jgi:hypothetical protein
MGTSILESRIQVPRSSKCRSLEIFASPKSSESKATKIYREDMETLERLGTGPLHPAMEPIVEGAGGDQTAPTRVSSPYA